MKDAGKDLAKRAEAEEDDIWGRIAFAQNRTGVPYEKNTEDEQITQDSITDYLTGNAPFDPKVGAKIMSLIQAGKYKKTLKKPLVKTVYRGVALSAADLRTYLSMPRGSRIPESGVSTEPVTVTKKRGGSGSTSWSKDRAIAQKFADANVSAKKPYIVIFEASTAENDGIFIDMVNFYEIQDISGKQFAADMKSEQEVIAVAPIAVNKITWAYSGYDAEDDF